MDLTWEENEYRDTVRQRRITRTKLETADNVYSTHSERLHARELTEINYGGLQLFTTRVELGDMVISNSPTIRTGD